jgi:hypothetical protein
MGGCSRRYPPVSERRRVIGELASLHTFTAAQVMGSKGAAPLNDDDCCGLTHIPHRPQGGRVNRARHYFGIDEDGYVIVIACSHAAQLLWPTTKDGQPLPVRVHRWMLNAGVDQVVRHTCDNPSCIRLLHIRLGTAGDNVADSWRRTRRASVPNHHPTPRQATPRVAPAPSLPAAPASCQEADTLFCMTGFQSPGKLARKRARLAVTPGLRLQLEVRRATFTLPPPSDH